MNSFCKRLSDLPEDPEDYFKEHYTSKISGLVTTQDLRDRLFELKLAWTKYGAYRKRIEEMAGVLKIGIGGFEKKEVKKEPVVTDAFKESVISELIG